LLFQLEAEAPELFERVRSGVFRAWNNPTLVSDFVLRWALAHGVAKIREYAHLYVATGDTDPSQQLVALAQGNVRLDFFCVNDTTDDADGHDPRLVQVKTALQSLFPQASAFEVQYGLSAVPALQAAAPRAAQGLPTLSEPRARRSGS
ncbi:MAG: exopolysaccharide phosphotransferase, partial [Hydrogenophaga sp.]